MFQRFALLCGAIAFFACAQSGVSAADNKSDKIRVVIVDGQNNHNWKATTPIMKKALEDCGRFSVDVSTSPPSGKPNEPGVNFPPDLSKYGSSQ
jgi:hypothetical protein